MNNVEIERKFLVNGDGYMNDNDGCSTIVQGYIDLDPNKTVRVRTTISRTGTRRSYLTIKGKSSDDGLQRIEVETLIKPEQSDALFAMCDPKNIIKKFRILKKYNHVTWEVDVFQGDNLGLVVAEVELDNTEDNSYKKHKPDFIGTEVTGDKRYYNSQLANNPYNTWE